MSDTKPAVRPSARRHVHPEVPVVDLLSPWAVEAIAVRRLRRRFLAGAVALMLLLAAGWTVQHLRVEQARQLLAVQQAEAGRLGLETQELVPVQDFVAAVEQRKAVVSEAMANEIYVSLVVDGLRAAAPLGATIESVSVTVAPPTDPAQATGGAGGAAATGEPGSGVSPCPGPDPFNTRTVVGCVTLSGTAASRAEVGQLVVQLGEDGLFVEPFISTTTTADAKQVVFSGSVGLSEAVFSKRYAKIDKLISEAGTS